MNRLTVVFLVSISMFFTNISHCQKVEEFQLSSDWLSKIENILPESNINPQVVKQRLLIFSKHTGYEHWTIPHTEAVIQMIAEKSGGYDVVVSKDIVMFEVNNLNNFDAIVLNNTCSEGDKRDLFWDVLKNDSSLSNKQRLKKAEELEENLLDFVHRGNGLMVLHGGIVMQNKSKNFGKMLGGSFDYHPEQQNIHVKLVDKKHPLVAGFDPDGFQHWDEPYFFDNAYFDYDFRPLLYMETDELIGKTKKVNDKIKYISWIKKHGAGRVFFCSPSHNAQSMENPALLEYFLKGLDYVTGNLLCDDSPMEVGSSMSKVP